MFSGSMEILVSGPGTLAGGESGPGDDGGVGWTGLTMVGDRGSGWLPCPPLDYGAAFRRPQPEVGCAGVKVVVWEGGRCLEQPLLSEVVAPGQVAWSSWIPNVCLGRMAVR